MDLILYKPILYGLKGRVGAGPDAMVYYRIGGQDIVRIRGIFHDPRTELQQTHRSIWTSLAQRYSALSGWRKPGRRDPRPVLRIHSRGTLFLRRVPIEVE